VTWIRKTGIYKMVRAKETLSKPFFPSCKIEMILYFRVVVKIKSDNVYKGINTACCLISSNYLHWETDTYIRVRHKN
jgi:hypothetical protein